MSTNEWLMLLAIVVQGPLFWWIGARRKKGEDMTSELKSIRMSIANVHKRVDEELEKLNDKYATKTEVEVHIAHLREVNELQFEAIMKNLEYIRNRLDEHDSRKRE